MKKVKIISIVSVICVVAFIVYYAAFNLEHEIGEMSKQTEKEVIVKNLDYNGTAFGGRTCYATFQFDSEMWTVQETGTEAASLFTTLKDKIDKKVTIVYQDYFSVRYKGYKKEELWRKKYPEFRKFIKVR